MCHRFLWHYPQNMQQIFFANYSSAPNRSSLIERQIFNIFHSAKTCVTQQNPILPFRIHSTYRMYTNIHLLYSVIHSYCRISLQKIHITFRQFPNDLQNTAVQQGGTRTRYSTVANQFLNWFAATPHRGVAFSHSSPSYPQSRKTAIANAIAVFLANDCN